jgi:hypothetical protein
MQTREGAEWNQMYVELRNKLLADPGRLGGERSQLLRTRCGDILKKPTVPHGESKVARRTDLVFGDTPPATDGAAIPVWVRDGWDVEEKTVLADARQAGEAAAVVYGYVPKEKDHELRQAVASHYAATATLQNKGVPSAAEGIEACKAMETLQVQALQERDRILTDVLNRTRVFTAGGDEVPGALLDQKVHAAATACLVRLYPKFDPADSADWHKVFEQAKKGDPDALAKVSHKGEAKAHPVCKAVLDHVGSGKKGTAVRKFFGDPPYGWPQDAVDAALVVLTQAGLVQAKNNNDPLAAAKLDQKAIAVAEFRSETVILNTVELIAIRGLFKEATLTTQPGQEQIHAPEFLNQMQKLATAAGGDAPLPARPDTAHLTDRRGRRGSGCPSCRGA